MRDLYGEKKRDLYGLFVRQRKTFGQDTELVNQVSEYKAELKDT